MYVLIKFTFSFVSASKIQPQLGWTEVLMIFVDQVIMLIFYFENSKVLNFMWREYSDFFHVIYSDK